MKHASLIERWGQTLVMVLGAAVLLVGLGSPGLWEPWEMDRAFLATSLNNPPEIIVATPQPDDGADPLATRIDEAAAAHKAVVRRPDAATASGDRRAFLRMALDMARNREAAGLILDERLFVVAPGENDSAEQVAGNIDEALNSMGRAPVILLSDAADRNAHRNELLLARARSFWQSRAEPWGLRHIAPENDAASLDAALAAFVARDPDAQRLIVIARDDAVGLGAAIGQGLDSVAGIVQFRDNGTLRVFAPLDARLRATSLRIFGRTEFAARLPGVLLALAALAVLLGALRVVWGARVAFLAGLVTITLPLFYDQARILAGEPGNMFALTIAASGLLLATRATPASRLGRALPLVYLGIGLIFALFSKGLFGVAIIAAMALVDPLVRGSRRLVDWVPAIAAIAVTGLVAALVASSQPGDFMSQFAFSQALFSDGPEPYLRSFDLIIRSLGFGLAPWSPVVVVAIGLLTFGALTASDRRGLVIASWFFIPTVALMVTLKDHNHFIFAAAPAAAVAVALLADRIISAGYRNTFVAIALLFMYFILRNELKQSPEPLVSSLTFDPPFTKEGQLRFPEGLELGFLFKTMLALAAAFCLLHIGRLGDALGRLAAVFRRERPFIIAVASVAVLFAVTMLVIAARPHGRAMGSSYLELLGPGQRDFIKNFVSFREPLMIVGVTGAVLLAALATWRFARNDHPDRWFVRHPRLGVWGWGLALTAWSILAVAMISTTAVPADFWGETLVSSLALPAWLGAIIVGYTIYRLSNNKFEGILAALALATLALATRFIRDTGASDALITIALLVGALSAVTSFALRILATPERFALGAAGFIALILFAFAAPLIDRYSYLSVVIAQGAPVESPLSLFKSMIPIALLGFIGILALNARGAGLLARVRLTPAFFNGALDQIQRGRALVIVLIAAAFVITGLNIFRFQNGFAVNVSQKHIIETWHTAAGPGADGSEPEARILRHGSFGRSGGRDTNFYTSGFAEIRDRQAALKVLLGSEDQVVQVETRNGTEFKIFPGFAKANDSNGDGRTDVAVERGFATQVEMNRIIDRTRNWSPGAFKGHVLHDSNGQTWRIDDNDATSLTVKSDGRWTFALKPASRAAYAVAAAPLNDSRATAAAAERRALLVLADNLSDINHAYRELSNGEHLPVLEGSSYRVLLAVSNLEKDEQQQNRLALATFNDATFKALKKPNMRRVWGNFEDTIQVVGYDIDKPVVGGNERLRLTVYYKTLKPVRKSLKIFMHFDRVGATNRIHGDHWPLNPTRHSDDNKNCNGCYRTDHWMPGDIVADTYDIEIPEGSSAGEYMMWLGLFQPGADTRLKLTSWDQKNCKHDGANRLGLGTFTVR